MNLKSIKLVGFKSFVDATTIPIKSYMNAIVGPNGCGKSNVVDAIRWVIGETSAKQLRSQSMADVIFNGTSTRKPVGRAAIELLFENNKGRLTGEYARYSEIAIRREVERDGQSSYIINGVQCRRRDVVDIFLGTGLGPRSYAIIEQGMVTRLIEAKPEELRIYLEEAAGISKYKERRRETENRMRHTQDNLDRLNDLLEELTKQLRHLKRQANAAERYQELKQTEQQLHAEIKTLHWQCLNQELADQEVRVNEQNLCCEEQRANLRHLETDIEKKRVVQTEFSATQNEVQKRYYGLAAEIARLEQQIKHVESQTSEWREELERTHQMWTEITDNNCEHQQQITLLGELLEELLPQTTTIKEDAVHSGQALTHAELEMNQWQEHWEVFQAESSKLTQQVEVAKNNIQHYQQQLTRLDAQKIQLQTHQDEQQLVDLEEKLQPLANKADAHQHHLASINEELTELTNRINQKRSHNTELNHSLKNLQQQLSAEEGRYATLNAMQQIALGVEDEQTNEWLKSHSLDQLPRLGKALRVKPGWEVAIETVLGSYFDAVCVDDISQYLNEASSLTRGRLTLVDKQSHFTSNVTSSQPTLAEQVESEWPLQDWLAHVYIAEDLSQALQKRAQLAVHESVITREGVWLGPNWLRRTKASDNEDSVLLREQSLQQLQQAIAQKRSEIKAKEDHIQQQFSELVQLEKNRDAKHEAYQQQSEIATADQSQLAAKQSRLDELQQRQQHIATELNQCQQQIEATTTALGETQSNLTTLLEKQQTDGAQKQQLLSQREQYRESLVQARSRAQQDQQRADELSIRLASNEEQLTLLKQTMARDERQLIQLTERREDLTARLANSDAPLIALKDELQSQLEKRVTVEKELRTAEEQLQTCVEQLQQMETQRNEYNDQLSEYQSRLEALRMERQSIRVRQETIKEQLQTDQFDLEALIQALPQEAELAEWEARAEKIAQRINRLGPINLAAIDEYNTILERKDYLDRQQQDLVEALTILESAIRKIDRETKTRFRDTLDKVNQNFQAIFPRVFGGGRAMLDLTDDDLLSTGIIVRAQPPGKRNSTIQMLSGGEKALTAISLVFAMFQLNPAPFCILDEVDAPLDDVNVGRFCQIVKEMSKDTQFIVISHNKVTIEQADHLLGVTMQEAGVSRIVSVDMEQAIAMVE